MPRGRTANPARALAAAAMFLAGCTRGGSGDGGALFTDATRAAGIHFRLTSGARGEHYLVETMLGGLGWIDYDGDGDFDLYAANGHEDPLHAASPGKATNRLYRNDGAGRFDDVTDRAGVGDRRYTNGVAVADWDADGHSDLLCVNYGRSTLYRNRGDGSFEDVTERAGLTLEGYGASAAFFDYDRDGDLDIYVVRYLQYDPAVARPCVERGVRVYCHPRFFHGQPDLLYENLGNGVFREVGSRAGIDRGGKHDGKGLGVIAIDFDRDGWTDVYVANDTTPNFLWRNRRDGTFEDVAFDLGVAVDRNGGPQAGMGVDWGDVDGDGLFDIHVTNFWKETNNLYAGLPGGGFVDIVQKAGMGHSFLHLGFGTVLADFDLDGDLDAAVANGHVDDRVESDAPGSGATYRQPPDVYLNDGRGRFTPAGEDAVPVVRERFVGRGLASSDFDGDGDVDLAIATLDRGIVVLRNDHPRRGHFLKIRLRGAGANRDAYGARVEVRVGARRQVFEYQSARSYLSAVDPRVIVGLGAATRADEVTVRWPGGGVSTRRNVVGDRELIITEGERGMSVDDGE